MVSNPSLITKQMLTFYSADSDQGRELTRLWDRVMIEVSKGGGGRGVGTAGGPGAPEVDRAPQMPTVDDTHSCASYEGGALVITIFQLKTDPEKKSPLFRVIWLVKGRAGMETLAAWIQSPCSSPLHVLP